MNELLQLIIPASAVLIWLIRLEGKVLAVERYINHEPEKFEKRIGKLEHDIGVVRGNLNQIAADVSFIRGFLTDKKHID